MEKVRIKIKLIILKSNKYSFGYFCVTHKGGKSIYSIHCIQIFECEIVSEKNHIQIIVNVKSMCVCVCPSPSFDIHMSIPSSFEFNEINQWSVFGHWTLNFIFMLTIRFSLAVYGEVARIYLYQKCDFAHKQQLK